MNLRKWVTKGAVTKLFNWEYWPTNIVYAPVGIYWLWLSLKCRSCYFMTAANPSIHTGGFVMESKNDVYKLLPPAIYPKTVLIEKNTTFIKAKQLLENAGISFPCIAKPDIGMQGLGVKKIASFKELETYYRQMPFSFLVQSYVAYPNEAGVFFHRMPNEKNGKISGIVLKEFASVMGDGKRTVEQLVDQHKRYSLYRDSIAHELGDIWHTVLSSGEQLQLLDYGNHARGSKFTDGTHLITPGLEALFNTICTQIPGFYYGRLDIKYKSWNELQQGKNFSIIELNGSGSSPTHIFDPKHSIFFAWKEIARHWRLMYQIASYNHTVHKVAYLPFAAGIKEVKASGKIKKVLSSQNW